MKKRILLIDSANIFHSKKYSYIQGAETNIIEPFLTEIREIVFKLQPDMVVLLNDKYKIEISEVKITLNEIINNKNII